MRILRVISKLVGKNLAKDIANIEKLQTPLVHAKEIAILIDDLIRCKWYEQISKLGCRVSTNVCQLWYGAAKFGDVAVAKLLPSCRGMRNAQLVMTLVCQDAIECGATVFIKHLLKRVNQFDGFCYKDWRDPFIYALQNDKLTSAIVLLKRDWRKIRYHVYPFGIKYCVGRNYPQLNWKTRRMIDVWDAEFVNDVEPTVEKPRIIELLSQNKHS